MSGNLCRITLTREVVAGLVSRYANAVQAARSLGVHESSIRRACRRYGFTMAENSPMGSHSRKMAGAKVAFATDVNSSYLRQCSTKGCPGFPIPATGRCCACEVKLRRPSRIPFSTARQATLWA